MDIPPKMGLKSSDKMERSGSKRPCPLFICLTPRGRGAVAVVRIVMDESQLAQLPLSTIPDQPNRLKLVHWNDIDKKTGESIREDVVVRRLSAESMELFHGFSGIEVCCHGGTAAVRRIEKACLEMGLRKISRAEWYAITTQSEPFSTDTAKASELFLHAASPRTAATLFDQSHGAMERTWTQIYQSVQRLAIQMEVFPEDFQLENPLSEHHPSELDRLKRHLRRLHRLIPYGQHLIKPFRLVLFGSPNVGKSSLLNALAGYRRAIVHAQPGTTRDCVEETIFYRGIPLLWSDTAGVRDSHDPLEVAGMEQTFRQLQQADLVLELSEFGHSSVSPTDQASIWNSRLSSLRQTHRWLFVVNKMDLCDSSELFANAENLAYISVKNNTGIQALLAQVVRRLVPTLPKPGEAVPFLSEHARLIRTIRHGLDEQKFSLILHLLESRHENATRGVRS